MYAVIKTGGKQYRVAKDEVIAVEKLAAEAGSSLDLGEVLMLGDDKSTTIGSPLVEGASVSAKVVEQARDDKIIVFKKIRRKNYRRKKGHRQAITLLRITDINAPGTKRAAESSGRKTAKKADETPEDTATTAKAEEAAAETATESTAATAMAPEAAPEPEAKPKRARRTTAKSKAPAKGKTPAESKSKAKGKTAAASKAKAPSSGASSSGKTASKPKAAGTRSRRKKTSSDDTGSDEKEGS